LRGGVSESCIASALIIIKRQVIEIQSYQTKMVDNSEILCYNFYVEEGIDLFKVVG
jgi:hypothetical protein